MVDFEKNREQTIQAFLSGGGENKIETTRNRLDDSYLDDFGPLEVKVYGHNFERAFKMFRQMVQKERILSVYKQFQGYEKPSEKKRRKANEMRQKQMEIEAKRLKILSGEFEKELIRKQKAKDVKKQLKEIKRQRNGETT